MDQEPKGRKFDLEDRTLAFAIKVRQFVRELPRTVSNTEDVKQLVRASGSIGANYIEANEGLGKKDFLMHLRICRKEAKESGFFLRLIHTDDREKLEEDRETLIKESKELVRIFSSIINKTNA